MRPTSKVQRYLIYLCVSMIPFLLWEVTRMQKSTQRVQAWESVFKTSTFCDNVSRPHASSINIYKKYLQLHKDKENEIYLYSAFYDNRQLVGLNPILRIFTISTKLKGKIFCLVWYNEYKKPLHVPVDVALNGRSFGHVIEGVQLLQYMYNCALPTALTVPVAVSIVSRECGKPMTYQSVHHPIKEHWKHEFGVCVPISYGHLNPYNVVEWIETIRFFGVSEITFYPLILKGKNLSEKFIEILESYQKEGLVIIRYIAAPKNDTGLDNILIGYMSTLNDCMYRNMYRFRYLYVIDTDEAVIPRLDTNYSSMVARIEGQIHVKGTPHQMMFRNSYFWTGCDKNWNKTSYFFHFNKREKPSDVYMTPKSFIDPRTCLSVFPHYCWRKLENLKDPLTIYVDEKVGLLHHYRELYADKAKSLCENLKKHGITDNTLFKYKSVIQQEVDKKLKQVNLS